MEERIAPRYIEVRIRHKEIARARTRPLELVAYSPPFAAIDTDRLPSDGAGLG
jgi:hypothetical protein